MKLGAIYKRCVYVKNWGTVSTEGGQNALGLGVPGGQLVLGLSVRG